MIAYLKGTIKSIETQSVVLFTGSVGYRVYISLIQLRKVHKNDEVEYYIYHHITDSQQNLYGFENEENLRLFQMLISISGIGPKNALSVLNKVSMPVLSQSVFQQDAEYLHKTSGIGKKTAERIVLGLKGKMVTTEYDGESQGARFADSDVIDALSHLGYSDEEVRQALRALSSDITSTEQRISAALQYLGQKAKV